MMTRLFKSLSEMRGLQGRALWCVLRLRPAGMGSWTRHPCAAEESWAPHWTQSVFPPHRTSRSLLINSTPETPQPSPTPPTHCQLHLTPKTQSTSMEASTTATVATGPWGAACSRLPPSRRATTVTVSDHTLHWEPPRHCLHPRLQIPAAGAGQPSWAEEFRAAPKPPLLLQLTCIAQLLCLPHQQVLTAELNVEGRWRWHWEGGSVTK